jgi:nucleoid DNA-binding protein
LLLTNYMNEEGTEMNKGELVNAVTKVVCAKKEAVAAVDCVLETITKALKKGDKVTLVGFGTFSVAKRAARTGRNPKTGAAIKIKAKKVPKFTAGKTLKDTVAK